MYLHRAWKQICFCFDGVAAGCSSVLEVGEELGVEDGVARLDVVDSVEGVHCGNWNDGKDDRDPDGCLFASKNADIGGFLDSLRLLIYLLV